MLGEVGETPPESVAGVAAPDVKAEEAAGNRGVGTFRRAGIGGLGEASNHTRMAGFPISMPAM